MLDEIKPTYEDHIIIERRDSTFHDTELRIWLRTARINPLIFSGIDSSICIEASLRDWFNQGYGLILVADATASGKIQHYDRTLERVRDYYGRVTHLHEFEEIIKILEQISGGKMDYGKSKERLSGFHTIDFFCKLLFGKSYHSELKDMFLILVGLPNYLSAMRFCISIISSIL